MYSGAHASTDKPHDSHTQRAAMETQVSEFGQTPKQLFVSPHPKRVTRAQWTGDVPSDALSVSPTAASSSSSRGTAVTGSVSETNIDTSLSSSLAASGRHASVQRKASGEPLTAHTRTTATQHFEFVARPVSLTFALIAEPFRLHRESVTGLCVNDTHFAMVSRDGMLKVNEQQNRKQVRATSVASGAPLSCCQVGICHVTLLISFSCPPSVLRTVTIPQFLSSDHILVGSWDSKVYTYSIAFNRSVSELPAHDDAVRYAPAFNRKFLFRSFFRLSVHCDTLAICSSLAAPTHSSGCGTRARLALRLHR